MRTDRSYETGAYGRECKVADAPEILYPDDGTYDFALCLTPDIDLPAMKFYHAFVHGVDGVRMIPLERLKRYVFDDVYWCFDEIRSIQRRQDVRSALYFLNEKSLSEKLPKVLGDPEQRFDPDTYLETLKYHTYYDIYDEEIRAVIADHEADGWEIGLHSSKDSFESCKRLSYELTELVGLLDGGVRGCC